MLNSSRIEIVRLVAENSRQVATNLLLSCFLLVSMNIQAQETQQVQQVYPSNTAIQVASGDNVSLDIFYTTANGNLTSGMGVRIHFNSTLLEWKGYTNLFDQNKIGQDTAPQLDTSNYDDDLSTDRYLNISWTDFSSAWPGTLPKQLYTANFTVASTAQSSDQISVNFSSSGTAFGYVFSSTSAQITIGSSILKTVPILSDIPPQSGRVSEQFSLDLTSYVSEADGDTVTYTVIGNLPAGLTQTNGTISGIPTLASQVMVSVKASDVDGDSATKPLVFTINEVINTPPELTFTTPTGTEQPENDRFLITWQDADPDSNAMISLFYDTDATGKDGVLIASGISEDDSVDSFSWAVTSNGVPSSGDYYLYAVITDGVSEVVSYSANTLTIDTGSPMVTAPANLRVEAEGKTTTVSLGTATATDDIDGTLTPSITSLSQNNPFDVGIHTVTWGAMDASGNIGSADQRVEVVDTTPPSFSGSLDSLTIEATAELTPVTLGSPKAIDSVDGELSLIPDKTGPFAFGAHSILWSVSDQAGNLLTVPQSLIVEDTTAPLFTIPSDITLRTATNAPVSVEFSRPVVSDIFPVTVTIDAPAVFPVGSTVVTWTAEDPSGNKTTGQQQITIIYDDHASVIGDQATLLPLDASVSGVIETTGDRDVFKINVTEDGDLIVKTLGITDTFGALYDSSGQELVHNDDSDTRNFQLSYSVVPGLYYIVVNHYDLGGAAGIGAYQLVSQFILRTNCIDIHGDDIANAVPIQTTPIDAGIDASIGCGGDVDMFKITLDQPGTLMISTLGDTDTYGQLLNGVGDIEVSNDDGGSGRNFILNYPVEIGSYFVLVRHYDALGGTGNYQLNYEFTSCTAPCNSDDHGDTPADASLVQNLTIDGRIDIPGDKDVFAITLSEEGVLIVNTTGITDTVGDLIDSDQTTVLLSNDDTGGRNFRLSKLLLAGTYYVRVRGYASDMGDYALNVVFNPCSPNCGQDDYGDTLLDAEAINSTSTINGSLELGGDVDVFKLTLDSSGVLTVHSTGLSDTKGTLLDSSGNVLSFNDDTNGRNFELSEYVVAGTYFVKVEHYSSAGTGDYALVSSFNGGDDYGNTNGDGYQLSANSVIDGYLDQDDVDVFHITLVESGTLTLNTLGITDTVGTLVDANNNLIIENDDDQTRNFRVSEVLSAGNYYIKVTHYSGGTGGAYRLVSAFVANGDGAGQ